MANRVYRALRAALAVAACALLVGACAGRQSEPVSALRSYARALEQGDFDTAYQMMSESFRAQHSKADFVRMMKDNPTEVRDTATRLRQRHTRMEVTAEFSYDVADRMVMVREGDDWHVASNPIAFYSQATPRDTLRSFLRAYTLKRWDRMLRFVPREYRKHMTVDRVREQFSDESVELTMKTLEANANEPIQVKGNEARMPYAGQYEVKFVREDGLWRIQDPA